MTDWRGPCERALREHGGESCRRGRREGEAQSEATVGKAKRLNGVADDEGARVNVPPSSRKALKRPSRGARCKDIWQVYTQLIKKPDN